MSKTVDDLLKVYIEAFDAMKALKDWPNDSFPDGTCERAGIAAVIRALRDEFREEYGMWERFSQILGDAGEKVAGVAALEAAGAGLSPASGQTPATDPCPHCKGEGCIRQSGVSTLRGVLQAMTTLIENVARVLDPAAWRLIDDNLDRPEGTALHKAGVRYRDMSLTKARAAIAAVLEHLADNVSNEMVEAARNANWHNVERSAISAALRAAAGSALEAKP